MKAKEVTKKMEKIEILQTFKPFSKGNIIDVEMNSFWRRRIEDGSAKIVEEKAVKPKSIKSSEE